MNNFLSTLTVEEKKRLSMVLLGKGYFSRWFLGSGCTRTTYALSERYVVKVSLYKNEANITEAQVWNEAPSYIKEHLAELKYISKNKNFVIMERMFGNVECCYELYADAVEIVTEMGEYGISDLLPFNLMLDADNNIKVIDYANCSFGAENLLLDSSLMDYTVSIFDIKDCYEEEEAERIMSSLERVGLLDRLY